MNNLKQTYINYANYQITNNYWFRYTDIVLELGISIDELCDALGLTYEIKYDGYYIYKFGKLIRIEGDWFIKNSLWEIIYHINYNGWWKKYKYNNQGYPTYYEDLDGKIKEYKYSIFQILTQKIKIKVDKIITWIIQLSHLKLIK